jgi:NAD(P)-dependent dehydrogenase (short-subunit alcohol dehydrogenase family)
MAIADVSSKSLQELISLKGRVAVVTGGSRGLGFAICKRLTQAGAAVFVAARNEEGAKAAAEEIQKLGGNAIAVSADATDSKALGALADQAISEFGRLDIWVNNAGVSKFQPLWEVTDDQWSETIDANLSSAFYGSREAAKRMRDAGNGGVIINLSSTQGFRAGGPMLSHYISAKHGVRGLTKSLAVELGQYGIRVLALAPTYIITDGTAAVKNELGKVVGGDPEEQVGKMLPLGRVGVPDDVARVALFCASDLSMFMTGDTLLVDAGNIAL